MSRTQVVTLQMPVDLKRRLEREAQFQGVSINELTNDLINMQLSQLEMISSLDRRLTSKNLAELKKKVGTILARTPNRNVPEWDEIRS
jgi:hypothetical protein